MLKRKGCAFQDGSYPCGHEGKGKLPDCELCHKIRKAGIKELADWVKDNISFANDRYKERWLAKLKELGIKQETK